MGFAACPTDPAVIVEETTDSHVTRIGHMVDGVDVWHVADFGERTTT